MESLLRAAASCVVAPTGAPHNFVYAVQGLGTLGERKYYEDNCRGLGSSVISKSIVVVNSCLSLRNFFASNIAYDCDVGVKPHFVS